MDWRQYTKRLQEIREDKNCSFCIDSDWCCEECRIDYKICELINNDNTTLYDEVWNAMCVLDDKIYNLTRALRRNYREVK